VGLALAIEPVSVGRGELKVESPGARLSFFNNLGRSSKETPESAGDGRE
jgi:hypothetical protein